MQHFNYFSYIINTVRALDIPFHSVEVSDSHAYYKVKLIHLTHILFSSRCRSCIKSAGVTIEVTVNAT